MKNNLERLQLVKRFCILIGALIALAFTGFAFLERTRDYSWSREGANPAFNSRDQENAEEFPIDEKPPAVSQKDMERVSGVLEVTPPLYSSLTASLRVSDLETLNALINSNRYWRLWPSAIAAVSFLGSTDRSEQAARILETFILNIENIQYVEERYIEDALLLKTVAVYRLGLTPSKEATTFLVNITQGEAASKLASSWMSWIDPASDLTVEDYASLLQGRAHTGLLLHGFEGKYDIAMEELRRRDVILANELPNQTSEEYHNSIVLLRDELCDGLASRDLIASIGMARYKEIVGDQRAYVNALRPYVQSYVKN